MIQILPLGAGQGNNKLLAVVSFSSFFRFHLKQTKDVGRSCIIVTLGGRTVMFDCGMHMGFNDERRFPDFTAISAGGQFDRIIDLVIISHLYERQIIH
jgi:predicted metal-dependent RNase